MLLAFDTESTTWSNGNPFDQRNHNVCISYTSDTGKRGVVFEPILFKEIFDEATTLAGFNLKFDLHWLRKLGFDFSGKKLWCCQVAEFLKNRQQPKYPSLNGVSAAYSLGEKIDVIHEEYWSKGINTNEIPRDILAEYAQQDADLTFAIYQAQMKDYPPGMLKLARLQMEDLRVLEEIEWNGLRFDAEQVQQKQKEIEDQIEKIKADLSIYHSVPEFNWGSGDHLSSLLYGGQIATQRRVPNGVYKTGAKAGQVKFSVQVQEYTLKRRYTPIRGSELKKPGKWATDVDTLTKLKGDRTLLDGILEISRLDTLNSTFVKGLLAKHAEFNWEPGYVHGQYNQVVAATGRLSSSQPNMQNLAGEALQQFITRF